SARRPPPRPSGSRLGPPPPGSYPTKERAGLQPDSFSPRPFGDRLRSHGLKPTASVSVDRPNASEVPVGSGRLGRQPSLPPLIIFHSDDSAMPAAVVTAPLNPQTALEITGPQKKAPTPTSAPTARAISVALRNFQAAQAAT